MESAAAANNMDNNNADIRTASEVNMSTENVDNVEQQQIDKSQSNDQSQTADNNEGGDNSKEFQPKAVTSSGWFLQKPQALPTCK